MWKRTKPSSLLAQGVGGLIPSVRDLQLLVWAEDSAFGNERTGLPARLGKSGYSFQFHHPGEPRTVNESAPSRRSTSGLAPYKAITSIHCHMKGVTMLQNFAKYAGLAQGALGILGTAVPGIGSAIGAGTGGNIFNILSGAGLSYLGFKGSESATNTAVPIISGLNALVGVLGAAGVHNIAGMEFNTSTVSTIISLVIGAWGLISTFMKKKA
jgi:hypothetical protein